MYDSELVVRSMLILLMFRVMVSIVLWHASVLTLFAVLLSPFGPLVPLHPLVAKNSQPMKIPPFGPFLHIKSPPHSGHTQPSTISPKMFASGLHPERSSINHTLMNTVVTRSRTLMSVDGTSRVRERTGCDSFTV